jgi:hypothetical protein
LRLGLAPADGAQRLAISLLSLAFLDHHGRQGHGCEYEEGAGEPELAHPFGIDRFGRGL